MGRAVTPIGAYYKVRCAFHCVAQYSQFCIVTLSYLILKTTMIEDGRKETFFPV